MHRSLDRLGYLLTGDYLNAPRMALRGDRSHFISLDKVIRTMRQTGAT